jgi:cytochrome c peroxidase
MKSIRPAPSRRRPILQIIGANAPCQVGFTSMLRWIPIAALAFALAAVVLADGQPSIPADSLPKELVIDSAPLGLDAPRKPKDNPPTAKRVALGRQLFFDPILSENNSIACASCHQPSHGFTSPDGRPRGIRGQTLSRKAPTLFNRDYGEAFFWDGRAESLEKQALAPIANPDEMGSSVDDALKRLNGNADYKAKFTAAFDDGLTASNLGKAIAAFERVLRRGDSSVDRFRDNGRRDEMTTEVRHGLWLYESKGRCWRCHSGSNFSDERFHNTGVSWGKEPLDLGRYAVTKSDADRGRFKTPTLRGVSLSASYMHDGSLKSLQDVVEFYNRGGNANPNLDPLIQPLNLTKDELADLVAFLKSL